MPRVSEAMDEIAAGLEHLDDRCRDRRRRDRQIARRQPLRHRHQVGGKAHGFMAPHAARASEAANHFVGDDEQAIFAGDGLDLGPIALGRDDHAAGALHGFADEGGAIFGADLEDLVLDRGHAGVAEGFLAHPLPFAVGIGLADMLDAGDRQVALRVHRLHPAERNARDGRTVIGVPAADEDGALRLALQLPIMAHHTEDGVVRLAARGVEEDVRQAVSGQARDLCRERHRGRRRGLEECVIERQLAHLRRRRLDQFLAAIADIDAPEARHRVEDALAVAVGDMAALGMGDDAAAAERLDFGPIGLRGKMVRDVEAAQFGDVVIAGHVSLPEVPLPLAGGARGGHVRSASEGREDGCSPAAHPTPGPSRKREGSPMSGRKADPREVAVVAGDAAVHNSPRSARPRR
ncbi:protein of unknown function [uncultured Sphingopyxis sp.]|uniref:Uncharacterized protein n=1 Tax=uncultured Sphingopyxis sp. TaxID=310581 RepID=A0A1Y5PSB8_9SPHN|nr:protein of unknown function [uncultured Sphingopyxis sp.]